ncbi:hypothetical protein ABZ897_01040 [Nonomuraea sp. NPDC046802]|uniref:hypothetical protein n=1 Tax=Nonomuraea sp. NPDC046802 TaxID=3154919 RepID=UPI0033DF476E
MTHWCAPKGIEVELIQLDHKQLFKVSQHVNGRRYLLGYCATIAQIARYVDLADLVEIVQFPAGDHTTATP